jgi:hypothetical protein
MTEKTEVRIRRTRRLLNDIDSGVRTLLILFVSAAVGVLSGVASAPYLSGETAWVWEIGIGTGSGAACLAWLFALAWSRRAWLIARTNFEILTDADETPETPSAAQRDAAPPAREPPPPVEVEGAVMRGAGIVFAVAMVNTPGVMDSGGRERVYREWLSDTFEDFDGRVVVLANREPDGRVTYQGRPDIVDLLVEVDPGAIPWRKFRSA